MRIVSQWTRFRDVYGGADQEAVFSAMTPVAEKLGGLLHGADILASAASTFDTDVQAKSGVKEPYDYWARGWLTRFYQYDRDKNKVYSGEWTEDDYVERHGETPESHFETLESERTEHQQQAIDLYETIESARNTFADTVSGVDMEELSELAYVNRPAALNPMDSPDELASVLQNSNFFGGMEGLTEEDYRAIAESVPLDDLPYDYMDSDGVKWSYNADGELVRSGSAEDPYLTYAVQLAIAEDDTYGNVPMPNVTAPDGSYSSNPPTMREYLSAQGISVAAGTITGMPKKAILNAAAKSADLSPTNKKLFTANVTTITTLVQTGWDTSKFEQQFSEQNPLLSDEQVTEQTRRYIAEELVTFLATTGTDMAATAAIPWTGVPGWVLVTLVSWGAGQVATAAVDEVFDQTWTEEERQEAYANGEIG
ncbi:hypothetical protein [Citricoccus sp. GCM10030269]|uniref:hypothetical protein n=1 Tax=Citricoccus sp. GCM10030269 TaxID=3273388 RepID=UPI003618BE28